MTLSMTRGHGYKNVFVINFKTFVIYYRNRFKKHFPREPSK